MATNKTKSPNKGRKTFASKRGMNPPKGDDAHPGRTAKNRKFQQHDIKGRLGSFETAGGHARAGSRGHS